MRTTVVILALAAVASILAASLEHQKKIELESLLSQLRVAECASIKLVDARRFAKRNWHLTVDGCGRHMMFGCDPDCSLLVSRSLSP